jgi:hypothetical protein
MNCADIECFHYRKHASIIRKSFPRTKPFGFDVLKIFGAGLRLAFGGGQPDTLREAFGRRNFYRIVVFNTALFGVGVYSALKSPFTSAFILEE